MSAMPDPICPDCGYALSTHDLFKDGRCPVVIFGMPDVEICPECGHSDQNHDENGCDVDGCECLGP